MPPAGICSAPLASPAPPAPFSLSEKKQNPPTRASVSGGCSNCPSPEGGSRLYRPALPWLPGSGRTHLLTLRGEHSGLVLKLGEREEQVQHETSYLARTAACWTLVTSPSVTCTRDLLGSVLKVYVPSLFLLSPQPNEGVLLTLLHRGGH